VPHATRWALPLPDAAATRQALHQQLEATLALLADAPDDADDTLYAFRLALLHEDMHHEAALYMARDLGLTVDDPRWRPRPLPEPPPPLRIAAGRVSLGRAAGAAGFAFDNECGRHDEDLAAFEIDAQALRWDEFLPFVESGHADRDCWTDAGWRWRHAQGPARAEQLQREARPGHAVAFISQHEAAAWCRWAGRRLPTEAEWMVACQQAGGAFRWGDVWEWTATPFAPFEGFEPHPYRDYSAPWFDGRPVLKGASHLTQPRLADARYRNFFEAGRCDIPAGLHQATKSAKSPASSTQWRCAAKPAPVSSAAKPSTVHLYEFSVWMRSPAAKRRSAPGQCTVVATRACRCISMRERSVS
jgi:gamma-glutamyl hercynylcysteine S-oxide synthase